jgi:GWxTD domain-containing protein
MWNRLIIGLAVVTLFGCSSSQTITKEDLSFLYERNAAKLRIPSRVYHVDSTRSELHFKLFTEDLLYRRGGDGDPFGSLVRMHYDMYDAADRKVLLDSGSVFVSDLSDNSSQSKELIGKMLIKRFTEKDLLVILTAHDLYRDVQSVRRLEVKKAKRGHRQNFILIDPDRGVPIFQNQLSHPHAVFIDCKQYRNQKLFGKFYAGKQDLPRPVFSPRNAPREFTEPDSLFTVYVDESGSAYFRPRRTGIYHLQLDTTVETGLSVIVLGFSYPSIIEVSDMLGPLRYITSDSEFDKIKTSEDPRHAIEDLWVDLAGGRERARQVIRAYYGRVENANQHFTSHKEGWRTDRGLVHIIFGIPNTIHKSVDSETWIYGEESSLLSMQFIFLKQPDIFTNNDMRLDRDPTFKSAWYRNVESWRNGRIYEQ